MVQVSIGQNSHQVGDTCIPLEWSQSFLHPIESAILHADIDGVKVSILEGPYELLFQSPSSVLCSHPAEVQLRFLHSDNTNSIVVSLGFNSILA